MGIANQAEMITSAIAVHDRECCTAETPCATRTRLLALVPGNAPAATEQPWQRPRGGGNTRSRRPPAASAGANDKQRGYLDILLAERDIISLGDKDRDAAEKYLTQGTVTSAAASRLIDALKVTAYNSKVSSNGFEKDRVQRAGRRPAAELEAGIYRVGDDWFKVQKAIHGSGNMYAKQLVVDGPGAAHFEYAAGAIRDIKPEHKASLEEAREFGHVYGVCCQCGATLTDENSIAAGIGPVCAKKF